MNKESMRPEAIPHVPEADSFDFRRSWEGIKQACLGHKLLIVFTCAVTVAVVIAYLVLWPPSYAAAVTIVATAEDDLQRDEFYRHWNVFRQDHLPDESQMMTSGPVLGKVVDELGLTYDDVFHPFMSHAAYLWTESWVGKRYKRVKNFVLRKKPNPYAPTQAEIDRARTVHDFKSGVSVNAVPETNVGAVVVLGPSPRVAQMADTLITTYLEERKLRYMEEAQEAYDSLAEETEKARAELLEAEDRMKEYYTENGLLLTFEKDKVEIAQWLELKVGILEQQAEISRLSETLAGVRAQLNGEQREVTSARTYQKSILRETLRDRMTQLRLALNQTSQRFDPGSPEVVELQDQIAEMESLINAEPLVDEYQTTRTLSETYEMLRMRQQQLEADIDGAKASLAVREVAVAAMDANVAEIPSKMKIFHEMNREHSILEKKYVGLQDKLTTAAISQATIQSAPPAMRVIEYATPPDKPVWPNTKLMLGLAVIAGLLAGVGFALIVDLIHARVNVHQLEAVQGRYPIFAIIHQDSKFTEKLFPAGSHSDPNAN